MAGMDARELLRPDPGPPALGESRAQVLAAVQDAGSALTVTDVAKVVGLHPNTARFHLDALVEAGFLARDVEDREQPGRPRVHYAARPDAVRAGRRNYRLLAEILASYLAGESPHPSQAAQEAGRAWGRYLTERPPPYRRTDAATAIERLVRTLDEIGFAPEAVTVGDDQRLLLHHCPFRETAAEHRDVVCSVHLGLMQGILAELDAPVEAQRLDPFVEPHLCVAHLAPGHGAATRDPTA